MTEVWLLPLLFAVVLTPVVLYTAYFVIVPRVMIEGYRRGMPSDKFSRVDGSEGAGSIDVEYYTLYFDVRHQDVVIRGPAPHARHWQIGAFDGMTRLIDGAYANHKTLKLVDGAFSVRLTAKPNRDVDDSTDEVFDCSTQQRGMVIFRIVLPREQVTLPEISK